MMHKTTMRLWYSTLLVIGLVVLVPAQAGSLEPPPGPVSPTRPPDTCYDDTGNRFVDCGDGTIKDTETGLYWLKDADCFIGGIPAHQWASANIAVAGLAHGQCGLTDGSLPGDWRLPTLGCSSGTPPCVFAAATGEFASIFAPSCPAPHIPNTAGTGCWSEGNPFSGVQSSYYWSANTFVSSPQEAWEVNLDSNVQTFTKNAVNYVWPIRGGGP